MALATVLMLIVVGAVSWVLTDRLVGETNEVATSTGEVLIATQQVSASFAEADAAAVSVHLAGEDGNREQQRLFEQATERATSSLERVARLVGDDELSHASLQTVAARTVEYAALIESARLSNIVDLSNADALLSEASAINRLEISPEVDVVAERARARFAGQTSSAWYAVAPILLIVALVVLLLIQAMMHRRFRRLINVPLALATLVLVALLIVGIRGFAGQQGAFNDAEQQAFDAISVSEELQQNAYRHRALATNSVLDNEPAQERLADLEATIQAPGGLLDQALTQSSSAREDAAAVEIATRWDRYVALTQRAQDELTSGDIAAAETIAQGSANAAFNGFNTTVEAALLDNREQFLGQLNNASDSLRWLRESMLFGSLLAAILAWWGFSVRIGEYR